MTKLPEPDFGIGHTVYVLSHHQDWGTPQLTLTTVAGIVWNPGSLGFRFLPAIDEKQTIDEIFDMDEEEEEAAQGFNDALEYHRTRRTRE